MVWKLLLKHASEIDEPTYAALVEMGLVGDEEAAGWHLASDESTRLKWTLNQRKDGETLNGSSSSKSTSSNYL